MTVMSNENQNSPGSQQEQLPKRHRSNMLLRLASAMKRSNWDVVDADTIVAARKEFKRQVPQEKENVPRSVSTKGKEKFTPIAAAEMIVRKSLVPTHARIPSHRREHSHR